MKFVKLVDALSSACYPLVVNPVFRKNHSKSLYHKVSNYAIYTKQLLDDVFVISEIIEVEVSIISRHKELRSNTY